jgi:endonuclease/exonuclease/phosphatase family metal-dependent hydrolase
MQPVKAKALWWFVVVLLAIAFMVRLFCRDTAQGGAGRIRIATFNIENFPQSSGHVDAAFAELASLDASIIALQEIEQPALVKREAHERLGDSWHFVHVSTAPLPSSAHRAHHIGVLFDRDAWTLLSTTVHEGTRLEHGRHKPTFEVRLQPAGGGDAIRVLVVHLKSGSDGRPLRARQLAALERIVRDVARSGERVVLLGDFNATEDAGDRPDIARIASAGELVWATEELACSAFWSRNDGCPRSRLDHVLTWTTPATVTAHGACATEGCDWQESCPIYREQVSDHCPVVVEF